MRFRLALRADRILCLLMAFACAALVLAGCSGGRSSSDSADSVGPQRPPAHADRTTPENAVRAYLDGITFAYRTADSEVASDTYSEMEYVRVDSYIELNRQEGRGIEQTLTAFEIRDLTGDDSTMTVETYEEWLYRYFSLDDLTYLSEEMTATYDATYTVVRKDDLWVVDEVKVVPGGEVQ